MRVKLTRLLPAACSLLSLLSFACLPTNAFPFWHKKPAQKQAVENGDQQATQGVATPEPSPAFSPAPAFSPTPTTRPAFSPASQAPIAPPVYRQQRGMQEAPSWKGSTTPEPSTAQPFDSNTGATVQPADKLPIIHNPPALPERPPIPPPPAVQAPLMVLSGDPTPSLSWRAVAYKLWITPEALPPRRSKSQSSFPFSSVVTMKALMKALSEAGWNTTQFSATAGHLLAVRSEQDNSRLRLIFAAHPGDGGTTVVRAATDPDSKNFDKNQLESIFSRAQDIAAKNDLL